MTECTVAFIGFGLIGGSIAKGFRRANLPVKIFAYARHTDVLEMAVSDGVVDEILSSPTDPRLSQCDYIFLCTPVSTAISYMAQIKPLMKEGCILTDVGSTKTEIHLAAEALGMTDRFIGGHPMAGSEKSGYAYATDHLVENAYYVLTPGKDVSSAQIEAFQELIRKLGAIVLMLDYRYHDQVVSVISHVPHLIAFALVHLVEDLDDENHTMKTVAAGGFKDITRIASSSPAMWQQICQTNEGPIRQVLQKYIASLEQVDSWIADQDSAALGEYFAGARDYRDSIPAASLGPIKKDFAFYVDIVDESGAIATIATILSTHQISIKNIGIIHNRDYEEGVLKVEFYDQDSADAAAEWLKKFRYTLYER